MLRDSPAHTGGISRFTFHALRTTDYGLRTTDHGVRTTDGGRFNPSTLQRCKGFTLVEILIALGIFSLVLAAIFSSWTAILRASKVGNDAAAAVQRARMAGRTIEESLGSAQSYAANLPLYSFDVKNGSDASLSFVARLAPSFPRSGKFGAFTVRRVTFSVEDGRDGSRQLVLRQNPLLMDPDVDEREHPLVLAKNVKQFKTVYWDPRSADWSEDWDKLGTNNLPPLVKVTLKLTASQYSSQVREQVTRIVSLPAISVQPAWQVPRQPPRPPQQQQQPPPP